MSNASDEDIIAKLTPKDSSRVLTGCLGFSLRLYWILRDIAELPAVPMPQKQINGVKPSASFIADWKASHPAYDHTLNEVYCRGKVEFWIKSCRAAWHAVGLIAAKIDKGDIGTNRWSLKTKTAISRLSHSLGNTGNNREHFFAELIRHLRRYPEMVLPNFYSGVDELSGLVTTLLIIESEPTDGEIPGIPGPTTNLIERSIPMSLTEFAVRLGNITPNKARIILKPYNLLSFQKNRQLWTVDFKGMPKNMRQQIENSDKTHPNFPELPTTR